jgi:hypothetical protein
MASKAGLALVGLAAVGLIAFGGGSAKAAPPAPVPGPQPQPQPQPIPVPPVPYVPPTPVTPAPAPVPAAGWAKQPPQSWNDPNGVRWIISNVAPNVWEGRVEGTPPHPVYYRAFVGSTVGAVADQIDDFAPYALAVYNAENPE